MRYTPLRITAELAAPVILPWHGFPLDGVLMATVIETPELRARQRMAKRWRLFNQYASRNGYERELSIYRQRYGKDPENVWYGHALPLAVWSHGALPDVWVYASSSTLILDVSSQDTIAFTRRFDVDMALQYMTGENTPNRIAIGKGEFKAHYLEFTITSTRELTWYVCGIHDEIERILFYVHSIGKKRRRGYGVVKRWRLEPCMNDESVWSAEGELRRPVPVQLLTALRIQGEFVESFCTYRPPYHDLRFAAFCAVSGRRYVSAAKYNALANET